MLPIVARAPAAHGPAAGQPNGRVAGTAGLHVCVDRSLHTLRMDRNAYRDDNDTGPSPDAYWRRRVITLVAGLTLLGLLAWAFSGGGGSRPPAPKGAQATGILPAAAYSGTPTSPSARSRPRPASPVGPAASLPFPSVTLRAPARASPGSGQPAGGSVRRPHRRRSGQSRRGRRPRPPRTVVRRASSRAAAAHRARWCSACSAAGPTITPGSIPSSSVYAVSTASRACTFDLGPGQAARAGHVVGPRHLGFGRLHPRRAEPAPPNSAAASRSRSRSPGTAPSACPAASRWRRRRAPAPTRCRPRTPAVASPVAHLQARALTAG